MLSANIHNFQPAMRANFALHAVEMILDCLFRERKMIGNFFVCEPTRQKGN